MQAPSPRIRGRLANVFKRMPPCLPPPPRCPKDRRSSCRSCRVCGPARPTSSRTAPLTWAAWGRSRWTWTCPSRRTPAWRCRSTASRLIWNDKNGLGIADTGRGVTSVNGARIASGKRIPLKAEDNIQIGKTVLQLKVILKKRTAAQK